MSGADAVLRIHTQEAHMGRFHIASNWKQGKLAAYLYGFDIDKYNLEREHKTFLRLMIADILQEWGSRMINKPAEVGVCHVWLMGTASRSGTWQHNSPLSKARAAAVRAFLEDELRQNKHPVVFSDTGVSEVVAFLKGKHDGTEDALDRSVILVAQWHMLPNPRPPIVKRPDPVDLPKPLFRRFLIRAVSATSDSLPPIFKKVPITAQHLTMDLEIMDVYSGEVATYGFQGAGPTIDTTPEKFKPEGPKGQDRGLPGIKGQWHDFKVLSDYGFPIRRCDSFAGGALFEDFSLLHKSWGAFYFDQDRRFPMKYHIPVRPFETGVPQGLKLAAAGVVNGEMVLKRKRHAL
jgi:hypothetical protein